jgi:hypothetical protein
LELQKTAFKDEALFEKQTGTFPEVYLNIFKTLCSCFSKSLHFSICETSSAEENIRLIALILRFPGLERDSNEKKTFCRFLPFR